MMSLPNFFGTVSVLLTLISGILFSNFVNLQRADRYDSGELKPVYVPELNVAIDIAKGITSKKSINKRVAGFCHHDYETITEESAFNYFDVFTQKFPGDGQMTVRLEMDIFNLYDCEKEALRDSVIEAAQFNIDKIQEAGYNVRIWFTEMPECLGQKIPAFVEDLLPDITGLLRPHVLPSANPDKFQSIVEDIIRTFTIKRTAIGSSPVTLFEGWNEVESPGYFFGTNQLLVDNIMIPLIKAVEKVEQEVGYELKFASHSVANGAEGFTPQVNVRVQNLIERRGYDVDWINWHWYGTFPFHYFSPPGIEFLLEPMERNNPWATPKELYRQTKVMQSKFPDKDMMLSEWNWGAGGGSKDYDYEAAAYVAGALIEMHHAGMKDANHFLLKSDDSFLNRLDQLNPTGYAMQFFHRLGANELEIEGLSDGDKSNDVSAIASYDEDKITLLITRFFGSPDKRNTTIKIKLQNIKSFIDSDEFTISLNTIDSNVFTGDPTIDTIFNTLVNDDDELELALNLRPQNTHFITIDTSQNRGIINSLTNNKNNLVFKAYPNPSNGMINVSHSFKQITNLNLYSVSGIKILSKSNINSLEKIENIPEGNYLIELESEGQTGIRQIIVTP